MKLYLNGTSFDVDDKVWQATVDEAAENAPKLLPEEYAGQAVVDMLTNTFNNRTGKGVDALSEKLKGIPADKLAAVLAAADAAADAELAKP